MTEQGYDNEDKEESTSVKIKATTNEVIIEFDYEIKWFGFDADGAISFAKCLIEAANHAKRKATH